MNEDMMSIRSKWNALIEDEDEIIPYMWDSLKIDPAECRIVKNDGKSKAGVQRYSIERSIKNNAKPDKNGLTFLSMRAIHFWRSLYEKRMNDNDINTREKISRAMHDDICGSLYAEIRELNDMLKGKGVVDREVYDKVCEERDDCEYKFKKLNNEYNKNMEIAIENEKKYANQEVIRLESKVKFLEEELRKMSKISANKN